MLDHKPFNGVLLYAIRGINLGWYRKVTWKPFLVDISSDKLDEEYGSVEYDISDSYKMKEIMIDLFSQINLHSQSGWASGYSAGLIINPKNDRSIYLCELLHYEGVKINFIEILSRNVT